VDETKPSEAMDRSRAEQILRAAVKQGASDVHFKAGERVLARVNGTLHGVKTPKLRPVDTLALFEALKPEHLDHITADTLQEADFSFSVEGAGRFRVNAFRQRGSIALVVRVIPFQAPDFKDLNLPETIPNSLGQQRGMILVTGATGHGKSTTLAAMVNYINRTRTSHVITIEDPIEFYINNDRSSVVQREIGIDTGSFAVALRSALRQDPNVIMIGEMRDTETIDIAMKAAETGHLVLSNAHTADAATTVQRVLSAFHSTEQAMLRVRLS
jgi:twitching motility protein PilT